LECEGKRILYALVQKKNRTRADLSRRRNTESASQRTNELIEEKRCATYCNA
jgi:hypothetical protein